MIKIWLLVSQKIVDMAISELDLSTSGHTWQLLHPTASTADICLHLISQILIRNTDSSP